MGIVAQFLVCLLPLCGLLWLDTAGRLIFNAAGQAIDCSSCPCGSGSSPPVSCECCSEIDYPPPATLYFSITNRSGCTCLDGMAGSITQTLPGLRDWSNSPGIANPCQPGGFVVKLQCVAGLYRLYIYCQPAAQAIGLCAHLTVRSCAPFHLVFSGVEFGAMFGACCPAGSVDVEITE